LEGGQISCEGALFSQKKPTFLSSLSKLELSQQVHIFEISEAYRLQNTTLLTSDRENSVTSLDKAGPTS